MRIGQRSSLTRDIIFAGLVLLQRIASAQDISRPTPSVNLQIPGAIQESGRGIVIGQQSKGGVLGATHYKLPNGFDIHVPLYDYRTAKGIRLEGRGVIPDVAVDLTVDDFRKDKDAVLDRVRLLLQSP